MSSNGNVSRDGPELSPGFFIRLVLSNFGQDAQDAQASVQPLRSNSDVLAVTGFGQTRDSTLAAADALRFGNDAVPIVSSWLTGNAFSAKRGFLRVGPTDQRLAEQGAKFVKNRFDGRKPFVVFDPEDAYSKDLGDEYVGRLANSKPLKFHKRSARRDFEKIAEEICRSVQGGSRPLVVYTARANELFQLLSGLSEGGCLDKVVVVGGDDLTALEADGFNDLAVIPSYRNLYFTTFGPADDEHVASFGGTKATESFFDAYRRVLGGDFGGQSYVSKPNGHVMLAYDAVNLVAYAIDGYMGKHSGLPSRAQLLKLLEDTLGFEGAAGIVTIGKTCVDPIDKLVVVQQVMWEQGKAPRLVNIWSEPSPVVADSRGSCRG